MLDYITMNEAVFGEKPTVDNVEMTDPEVFQRFREIKPEEVMNALEQVSEDPLAGIRIVEVLKGEGVNLYAALIRRYVNSHVHRHGNEYYKIAKGQGEMHKGLVSFDDNIPSNVAWEAPEAVAPGTYITIPENYAHCLKNTGKEDEPLVLIFVSDPKHLKNTDQGGDRVFVPNPLDVGK